MYYFKFKKSNQSTWSYLDAPNLFAGQKSSKHSLLYLIYFIRIYKNKHKLSITTYNYSMRDNRIFYVLRL